MVYVPLMFLPEWHEFPLVPCPAEEEEEEEEEEERDDSSCLHVVEIAHVAWHASFQPL